jgi:hypothetical protein
VAIRGRVGRHTQLGGRQCQNWSDDQKVVIGLLNQISPPNAGTGGGLRPRIVAGMASDELYKAIVAFENKHFLGQRSGFVDPGGKMYRKLWALAAPAPAPVPIVPPAPVAPPAPARPVIHPHRRSITTGERSLLRAVFEETLPYGALEVDVNTRNIGGENNSITPGGVPWFSTQIWCADFSDTSADTSTFIHEFTHVWQFYHGITKLSALWLEVRHLGDYEKAYPYDLSDSDDFTDFNIEQQASIIEDFWRVVNSLSPLKNIGTNKALSTYNRYVDQVRSAGPPDGSSLLLRVK